MRRGILRARTGAGSTLDEQCTQPAQHVLVDRLLANAEREATNALKEALTTLVDQHGNGISETLLLILQFTATDQDVVVHALLENFALEHLRQLRAAADRCDAPAFEELLKRASAHFGGRRAKPPEGRIGALLLQVTSCISELKSALKRLLSSQLEKFREQLAPWRQGTGAASGALSDRAVSTCVAALRRAADRGHAGAYLAALAGLLRQPRRVVIFSRKDSVITMPAQV